MWEVRAAQGHVYGGADAECRRTDDAVLYLYELWEVVEAVVFSSCFLFVSSGVLLYFLRCCYG